MSSNPNLNNDNEQDEEDPSSDSKADLIGEDEQDETVSCDSRDDEKRKFDNCYKRGKVYFYPDKFGTKLRGEGAIFKQTGNEYWEALEINTAKEEISSGIIKAEDSEWTVLKILRSVLEDLTRTDDFPSFLVHNINISCVRKDADIIGDKKTEKNYCEAKVKEEEESEGLRKEKDNSYGMKKGKNESEGKKKEKGEPEVEEKQKDESKGKEREIKNTDQSPKLCEKDVIIFHRRLGVVAIEVKATENSTANSDAKSGKCNVQKAVKQVCNTLDSLVDDKENSLEEKAITLGIALPKMIQETEEFMTKCRNQDIEYLFGTEVDTYRRWLNNTLQAKSSLDPYVPEGSNGDGDTNFRMIVTKYCKEPCYGNAVKECAQGISRWRVTEELKKIKDLEDKDLEDKNRFIHISGPPGAGKTLLLVDRARRWLSMIHHVAILIGRDSQDILLYHLGKECLNYGLQSAQDRLILCRSDKELLAAGERLQKKEIKLWVIIDEAVSDNYRSMLESSESGLFGSVWSADIVDNSDKSKFLSCPLEYSHRCSDDVMSTLNAICDPPRRPKVESKHVLFPQTLANKTEVIVHPHHTSDVSKSKPYNICSICSATLKDVFGTLGLISGNNDNQQLEWRDCIILYTGDNASEVELETLEKWLHDLKVPAEYNPGMGRTKRDAPILLPFPANDQRRMDEMKSEGFDLMQVCSMPEVTTSDDSHECRVNAWRECVLTGKSKGDKHKNVVHVLDSQDFRGLERPVVILVHIDKRDDDPKMQSTKLREERAEEHKQWWYDAFSCCQGKLIVLVLSPSPATHTLLSIHTRQCV